MIRTMLLGLCLLCCLSVANAQQSIDQTHNDQVAPAILQDKQLTDDEIANLPLTRTFNAKIAKSYWSHCGCELPEIDFGFNIKIPEYCEADVSSRNKWLVLTTDLRFVDISLFCQQISVEVPATIEQVAVDEIQLRCEQGCPNILDQGYTTIANHAAFWFIVYKDSNNDEQSIQMRLKDQAHMTKYLLILNKEKVCRFSYILAQNDGVSKLIERMLDSIEWTDELDKR